MRKRIFRYLFPPFVIGGLAALKTFFIDPAVIAVGLQGEGDLIKRIAVVSFIIIMLVLLFWIGPKYWGWSTLSQRYLCQVLSSIRPDQCSRGHLI